MTPQELKASILQLAIQGKLVEQRPEEGTGEELYKQIQAEKEELIKSGKIKKEKLLSEITEDEILFDIPENWKLARLGSICQLLDGEKRNGNAYPYLEARYLRGKTEPKFLNEGKFIHQGTNVILVDGENSGEVFHISEDGYMGSTFKVLFVPESMFLRYVIYFLQYHKNTLRNNKKGAAIPHLNKDIFFNLLFPIPPLAEQKRIVAKIEELLPYIERYEQAWSKLEEFNKKFPVDMQKSVFQMAIQGKLVEQRPEEGTGEEFFREILSKKQRLIKEGIFKKDKPLPTINKEDIPFELPDTWRWCYVGDIFSHNTGKAMNSSAKKTDKPGSIRKFITTSNLYWDNFDFTTVKEMFFTDDEIDRCTATRNDILMCEGGAYYGRTAIWTYDYDICFQNHVHRLRAYVPICERFFYYVFRFYRETGMLKSQGTAMPGLSSVVLHNMMVPLPPLAEQKRIVQKLEEILPLCERLK